MVLRELLAPAGSYEVFVYAVNAGANAIYLAGSRYGARAFAQNFTSEELEKGIKYAHLNGVSVHVTVNTLINNFETISVLKYLHYLYRIGVDAVIVQDIGILKLVKEFIPDLEIHSSTQMTIRDYDSILWASDCGVSRIILPREMSFNEIKNISKKLDQENVDMELEVFGHGSLCYCLSGKCYISSLDTGRSANRGACAQPCRKQYKLKYNNKSVGNGCLISTHDLGTYDYLKEISDAGVCSLKIEGRLKSADYVGTVVNAYKQLMNHMNDDTTNTPELNELKTDLELTFNRYFTKGYLMEDNPGDVMGRVSSYHQGVYLGKITDIKGTEITIDLKDKKHPIVLQNGDGIGFKYNNKIKGIYIDKILEQDENHIIIDTTREVRVGSEVYISYSKAVHDKIKKFAKERIEPNLGINLDLSLDNDLLLNGDISFEINGETIKFYYLSEIPFEKALKRPITKETIEKQMSKTGGTPFYLESFKLSNMADDLFIPIGQLNNIRRDILDKASTLLLDYYIPNEDKVSKIKKEIKDYEKYYKQNGKTSKNTPSEYLGLNVYVDNLDLLKVVCKYPILRAYIDLSFNYKNPNDYFNEVPKVLKQAHKIASDCELVWVLPSFISEEEIIKSNNIVEDLKEEGIILSIMSDSPGINKRFNCKTYGHHNLNVWNSFTVDNLAKSGFDGLTLSSELSYEEIKEINFRLDNDKYCYESKDIPLDFIIHGNLELMTSRDDFSNLGENRDLKLKNQTDYVTLEDKRKKSKIKIRFDYNKLSHFFNNECLSLIDQLDLIKEIGVNNVVLDCRFSSEKYINNVISFYLQGINKEEEPSKLKEVLNQISQSTMNQGNFLTGRVLEEKNY